MDDTYCLRCRSKTPNDNIKVVKNQNNVNRMFSTCGECGGKKSQIVGSKKGKGYNDGNTKWGTSLYDSSYGQGLIYPIPEDRYYNDDMNEFHNQDLNEFQDDITNRRINYMMAIYKRNNPPELDLENVALESDNYDVDPMGNITYDENGDPVLNMENLQEDENIIGEQVNVQQEEKGNGFMNYKPRGGCVECLKPTMRQTLLDANHTERQQYESEKWKQPVKNISENPEHLIDMISMEDMSLYGDNRKKGGDLFMKVGMNGMTKDTYDRWMERNGYKLNNDSYNDYVIKTRQKIYRNSDINNIESQNYPQDEQRFYVEPKEIYERDSYIQKSFGLPNTIPKYSKYGQLKFKKVVDKEKEQNERIMEETKEAERYNEFRRKENEDLLEQDLTLEEGEEEEYDEEQEYDEE